MMLKIFIATLLVAYVTSHEAPRSDPFVEEIKLNVQGMTVLAVNVTTANGYHQLSSGVKENQNCIAEDKKGIRLNTEGVAKNEKAIAAIPDGMAMIVKDMVAIRKESDDNKIIIEANTHEIVDNTNRIAQNKEMLKQLAEEVQKLAIHNIFENLFPIGAHYFTSSMDHKPPFQGQYGIKWERQYGIKWVHVGGPFGTAEWVRTA